MCHANGECNFGLNSNFHQMWIHEETWWFCCRQKKPPKHRNGRNVCPLYSRSVLTNKVTRSCWLGPVSSISFGIDWIIDVYGKKVHPECCCCYFRPILLPTTDVVGERKCFHRCLSTERGGWEYVLFWSCPEEGWCILPWSCLRRWAPWPGNSTAPPHPVLARGGGGYPNHVNLPLPIPYPLTSFGPGDPDQVTLPPLPG